MRKKTPEALLTPALVLAAVLLGAHGAPAEVLNRIVLRVNDRIATLQDYETRRAQLMGELMQQNLPDDDLRKQMEELGERVYRDLFEDLLLQSRADQLDIRITDEQVSQVVERIRQDMGIPDEATLVGALQQTGFTLEEFKENWRQNLRMREVITREVELPIEDELEEDDLRRYYRAHPDRFMTPLQVQVKEVVVLEDGPLDAEERQALAGSIREEIEAGRTLEEVVQPHAEKGETSNVIDLGWVEPGELSADLEAAVFDLPVGSSSQPLAARGGLHVMEVLDRKEPELQRFEEVVDQIRFLERRRLSQERIPAYMEDLEKSSYIKLDPPPDAEGFRAAQGRVLEDLEEVPEGVLAAEKAEEGAAGEAAEGPAPPEQEAAPEPPHQR
jgi:parvulin-like peptidyl-prolyl isomerase